MAVQSLSLKTVHLVADTVWTGLFFIGPESDQTLSTRFGEDFEVEVKAIFEAGVWSFFLLILNLGRDSEARFGQ